MTALDATTATILGTLDARRHRRPGAGRHGRLDRGRSPSRRRSRPPRRDAGRAPRRRRGRLRARLAADRRRRPGRRRRAGRGETRTDVDAAIDDGRLAGLSIDRPAADRRRDRGRRRRSSIRRTAACRATSARRRRPRPGPRHRLDDPKLYVTTGPATSRATRSSPSAATAPPTARSTRQPPAARARHAGRLRRGDPAGPRPGPRPARPARPATVDVYVIEPHAQRRLRRRRAAVRCPGGLGPRREPALPADDRQQLLAFDADGAPAAIDVGSHAFAWRLPGVIAGALMAACLYLLARILFRRRLVAGLVGAVRRCSTGCSSSSRGSA